MVIICVCVMGGSINFYFYSVVFTNGFYNCHNVFVNRDNVLIKIIKILEK